MPHPDASTYGDNDTLGGRISLARDVLALSIEQAAATIGVQAATWRYWENDQAEPIASRLWLIANVLKVNFTWLASGQGQGPAWSDTDERPPLVRARDHDIRSQ